jgi:dihydroorotate dehydrogenase
MTGGKIPLIGVGGISDADTAWTKVMAGASLLQVYSALVFQGPALIPEILDGLASRLRQHHLLNLSEAVGLQSSALA